MHINGSHLFAAAATTAFMLVLGSSLFPHLHLPLEAVPGLLAFYLLLPVSYCLGSALYVRARARDATIGTAISATVALAGHLLFTLRGGPAAAAWVAAVGMAVAVVTQGIAYRHSSRPSPDPATAVTATPSEPAPEGRPRGHVGTSAASIMFVHGFDEAFGSDRVLVAAVDAARPGAVDAESSGTSTRLVVSPPAAASFFRTLPMLLADDVVANSAATAENLRRGEPAAGSVTMSRPPTVSQSPS
ncbi:MAG: hypothetical protein M3326_14120 [Actinomycetota bacterium]|nr:hypothetical protein [Actinomycetota bacterium]